MSRANTHKRVSKQTYCYVIWEAICSPNKHHMHWNWEKEKSKIEEQPNKKNLIHNYFWIYHSFNTWFSTAWAFTHNIACTKFLTFFQDMCFSVLYSEIGSNGYFTSFFPTQNVFILASFIDETTSKYIVLYIVSYECWCKSYTFERLYTHIIYKY